MKFSQPRIRYLVSCLLVTTACLTLLISAWGYSHARITSQVQLRVADTKHALIAVMAEDSEAVQGETITCGSVTNNLSATAQMGIEGFGLSTYQLLPGETAVLSKSISRDERLGNNHYDGVIRARWGGGSADVRVSLTINVLSPAPNSSAMAWDERSQIGMFFNELSVPVTITASPSFAFEKTVIEPGEKVQFSKTGQADKVTIKILLPNGQEFELTNPTP